MFSIGNFFSNIVTFMNLLVSLSDIKTKQKQRIMDMLQHKMKLGVNKINLFK